jgi:thioredoxin reductase
MSKMVDVVIVGSGPYGLSIAAHLSKTKVSYRIFGSPMETWLNHMPPGMKLKSDGFASNLSDPDSAFTLQHYCAEKNIPYSHVNIPVSLETFVAYGLEFTKRFVPQLEQVNITSIQRISNGFELKTNTGEIVQARRVVMAVGITHFPYLPSFLSDLPSEYVSHSFKHGDISGFKGKKVVVVGAGASAVDIAAILNNSGASVSLIARRPKISFHTQTTEPRPLLDRIKAPRSGLGPGWRSRLCTDAPLLFHLMPPDFRLLVVRKHLGPAPGWFVRDQVVGRFPQHLGTKLNHTEIENGQVKINFINADGRDEELSADHVIGATGFRVAMSKLKFIDESVRKQIRTLEDTPVLSRQFESSVPGMYMVGISSANSFGPLTRFAYGASFTAKRISAHLAQRSRA